jgi:hypothetical protein
MDEMEIKRPIFIQCLWAALAASIAASKPTHLLAVQNTLEIIILAYYYSMRSSVKTGVIN